MELHKSSLHQDGCRRQPLRALWGTGGLATAMEYRGWNSVATVSCMYKQPVGYGGCGGGGPAAASGFALQCDRETWRATKSAWNFSGVGAQPPIPRCPIPRALHGAKATAGLQRSSRGQPSGAALVSTKRWKSPSAGFPSASLRQRGSQAPRTSFRSGLRSEQRRRAWRHGRPAGPGLSPPAHFSCPGACWLDRRQTRMSLGRRAGGPRGHQGSLRPAAAFAALAALLFALVSLLCYARQVWLVLKLCR